MLSAAALFSFLNFRRPQCRLLVASLSRPSWTSAARRQARFAFGADSRRQSRSLFDNICYLPHPRTLGRSLSCAAAPVHFQDDHYERAPNEARRKPVDCNASALTVTLRSVLRMVLVFLAQSVRVSLLLGVAVVG